MRLQNVNIILGIGVLSSSFASSFSRIMLQEAFTDSMQNPDGDKEEVYPLSMSSVSSSSKKEQVPVIIKNVIPNNLIPLITENSNKNPATEIPQAFDNSAKEQLKGEIFKNNNYKQAVTNGNVPSDEPEIGFLPFIQHYLSQGDYVPGNNEEKFLSVEKEAASEIIAVKDAGITIVTTTTTESPVSTSWATTKNATTGATGTTESLVTTRPTTKTPGSTAVAKKTIDTGTTGTTKFLVSTRPTTETSATTAVAKKTKTTRVSPLVDDDNDSEGETEDDEESKDDTSDESDSADKSELDADSSKSAPSSNASYINLLINNHQLSKPITIKVSNSGMETTLNMSITTVDGKKDEKEEEDEGEDENEKHGKSDREDDDDEAKDKKKHEEHLEDDEVDWDDDEELEDETPEKGSFLSANLTKEVQPDEKSQAAVYTSVLGDVPTSDVKRLEKILRSYFTEPRHWAFNASNTWHLKLMKELKSYGLKTFVQENTDLDKFWFYDEHLKDTELTKYPIVNVIGMLPGKNRGQSKDGILIVGAHYDTRDNSPGVDDNGSGMAVLMETARVLAKSNYKLENTIFFVAFDRKELGFGGSGLFVLEYLIPAELLVKRGYLQGAFIVDTVMNYDNRPRSQSIPKSIQEYSPEATKTIRKNKNRGDFLAVISRTRIDDRLSRTFMDNWKRINDSKYSVLEMQIDGTGNVERDEIFYKGYYFFASDHIYFWYHDSHEFNGTLPAVRLFDTGIERGRMRKCHHRACDNASFITEDNLRFLKKTTDALILSLIDLGKGTTMVPMSSDEEKRYPWNYFMYMGSAILSGTAFLATAISKLNSD